MHVKWANGTEGRVFYGIIISMPTFDILLRNDLMVKGRSTSTFGSRLLNKYEYPRLLNLVWPLFVLIFTIEVSLLSRHYGSVVSYLLKRTKLPCVVNAPYSRQRYWQTRIKLHQASTWPISKSYLIKLYPHWLPRAYISITFGISGRNDEVKRWSGGESDLSIERVRLD